MPGPSFSVWPKSGRKPSYAMNIRSLKIILLNSSQYFGTHFAYRRKMMRSKINFHAEYFIKRRAIKIQMIRTETVCFQGVSGYPPGNPLPGMQSLLKS